MSPSSPLQNQAACSKSFDDGHSVASMSGNVATFEVYATAAADSGDPGLEDFQFVLSHDVADVTIDSVSIVLATGLTAFPNFNPTTGSLTFGGFALPSFTDLSTPILTFNATILNDDTPFSISINNIIADNTNLPRVEEQFDFSSVAVGSTVVGRGGQALSDVRVSYDFVTPSGQEQSLELPMQAASKVSHAMVRGSDMSVTAEKAIDEASDRAITANDALQALRLAVGLNKSDGTAEWHDYIAADINKDGQVTANDALNILKFAVGLTDGLSADWVFIDGDADWSAIGRRNTSYEEGIWLEDVVADMNVNMTGILIGDVNGSYIA